MRDPVVGSFLNMSDAIRLNMGYTLYKGVQKLVFIL